MTRANRRCDRAGDPLQLGPVELVWWAISIAHEYRAKAAQAAGRGDFGEAGRLYGEALGSYDTADAWHRKAPARTEFVYCHPSGNIIGCSVSPCADDVAVVWEHGRRNGFCKGHRYLVTRPQSVPPGEVDPMSSLCIDCGRRWKTSVEMKQFVCKVCNERTVPAPG